MTSDNDHTRERGIEMNGLFDNVATDSFPIEKQRLLADYGQHELGFPDDKSATLRSVIEPAGVDEFHSIQELRETILQMVDQQAVGEEGQTGRGTSDQSPASQHRPPGKPEGEDNAEDPS